MVKTLVSYKMLYNLKVCFYYGYNRAFLFSLRSPVKLLMKITQLENRRFEF